MRQAGSLTQAIGLKINLYEYRCKKWWGCSVSRSYTPCTVRSYDTLKGRFSATLGEGPEVEVALV
jgi:hypothetical protein